MWPGGTSKPSSPEKAVLQQATWFTPGASPAWVGAQSEKERKNSATAGVLGAPRGVHQPLAWLPHDILMTRASGSVMPHLGGNLAANESQGWARSVTPDTPRDC